MILIRLGFFMTSVDLTNTYFVITLSKKDRHYKRFKWRNITYEYPVLMFGLGLSPRVFTKMLRVVLMFLRDSFGIMIIAYIDDLLMQAKDTATRALHSKIPISILQCLDYAINFLKSALIPTAPWSTLDSPGTRTL